MPVVLAPATAVDNGSLSHRPQQSHGGCRVNPGNGASAEDLLSRLRKRLDEPVSWDLKRRLIEVLVGGIRVETYEECGVKQARTTVTYRFSEPDKVMPLVISQSYANSVVRIPIQATTIGDHIRRRRLSLKMLQKEVAEQIGVNPASIVNWEGNIKAPKTRSIPAIIRFLGYDPLPAPVSLGERLVRHRMSLGLSRKIAAERLGVDSGTLANWERGEREPAQNFLERVGRFINHAEERVPTVRRAG